MTVAEELRQMGVPEEECESLSKKLVDTALASGYPNALENILSSVRFLISIHGSKASPELWATIFPS